MHIKKLKLRAQTVRVLSGSELEEVVGAVITGNDSVWGCYTAYCGPQVTNTSCAPYDCNFSQFCGVLTVGVTDCVGICAP